MESGKHQKSSEAYSVTYNKGKGTESMTLEKNRLICECIKNKNRSLKVNVDS